VEAPTLANIVKSPIRAGKNKIFAAICKRPQWLPLAVLLTAASVVYFSVADDSFVRLSDGAEESFVANEVPEGAMLVSLLTGGRDDVQAAIRAVVSACDSGDIDAALAVLRHRLAARYVRATETKMAASCCIIAWEVMAWRG